MQIKESKNIKFDLLPSVWGSEGGVIDPELCILDRSERMDDKIVFHFKNEATATIKGINIEGGREIDMIELKIIDLIGKSYKDILDSDII